ncbi:MAG: PASTA domain-containing protein [bacterium]|nr:PASTA domain-containing protein [bacterium]
MKKKVLLLTKIIGFILFYSLVLIASTFMMMSFLIKGEELKAPDFNDKSLKEAYEIATTRGVYLKPIIGNYGKQYKPLTVINQFPAAGVKIKEKSYIKIFVASELVEVIMPELTGYSLQESEKILADNDLRKRYVSYMDDGDVPVDIVISQSALTGSRVPSGAEIDLLVSRGKKAMSYIMPDIIGKRADRVLYYFESKGLKISRIKKVSYPGLDSDIIINQYPSSGFRINSKARIKIEVSE